ncbi:MAG: imidazole glycerol phosphate synthase subunit HisH [Bacteroidales bacterium]
MERIVVVNPGMGNIGSVVKKMNRIGIVPVVTSNYHDILSASKIILPGVGHFASGVKKLKESGAWDGLMEAVLVKKISILGICLGMQLMAKHSEEGDEVGFGWFDAEVVRFQVSDPIKFKVPHTGWNHVEIKKESLLFDSVNLDSGFYFVHSYHMKCNDKNDILSMTDYSYPFVSAVQKDNIFGVQFHPEKSHEQGASLLKNFISL